MYWKNKGNLVKYFQVTATFGITTAIRIYLLGVLGGGWADKKLGTSPWFMISGVLVAIFLSFNYLFKAISRIEKDGRGKEDK